MKTESNTSLHQNSVAPHFDEVIHAPVRLRICGLLKAYGSVRFDVLRDTLGISDATCSKHLKTLSEHGYVSVSKKTNSSKDSKGYRITWATLTDDGNRAFQSHVAALRQIINGRE